MMLPDLPMRTWLGPGAWSYSELMSLCFCEQKWQHSYMGEREHSEPSKAMERGTEIHRLVQHWWVTGEVLESLDDVAARCIAAYAEKYAANRAHVKVVAVELPFCVWLPWGGWLHGYYDLVVEIDGVLWIIEIKSMAQDGMFFLTKQWQSVLYYWSASQDGLRPAGVLLDGIVTTKVPRLLRETIEPDYEAVQEAVEQLHSATKVRTALRNGERRPLKNIGPMTCRGCFHAPVCLGTSVTILDEE